MSTHKEAFLHRDDFGNFEANLTFIRRTRLLARGKRILEIGSGKGHLLNHLHEAGHAIHGVEILPRFIAESRRLYGELPLTRVTSPRLPFQRATFDLVLGFDVLEHIADTHLHLAEVNRVLKTGGTYLLQTPNKWTNAVFETIRWRNLAWREDHCALHSFRELNAGLRGHGFEPSFHDIPIVNDFFKTKVRAFLGEVGVGLLKVLDIDRLPLPLRTNFYCEARKVADIEAKR
jgi:SAM-dependent methyltransferase